MAQPTAILEYWHNDTNWFGAATHDGFSAVLRFKIEKRLNRPAVAKVILANTSKDLNSSTAATATGNLSSVFTDYMPVRLKDDATNSYLIIGRVYNAKYRHDFFLGNIVELTIKDGLQELAEYSVSNAPLSLRRVPISGSTESRSELIEYIVGTATSNIITTVSDKFEDSVTDFKTNEKDTNTQSAAGAGLYDVSRSGPTLLSSIGRLAEHDPHKATDGEHFGFDFYVDSGVTSIQAKDTEGVPAAELNYFERMTRPGSTGTTSADPPKYGLTFEYPADDWTGETNFKKIIKSDANFDTDTEQLYTSAIVHFTDTHPYYDEDATNDPYLGSKGELAEIAEFELLNGTITGDFPWERKSLRYRSIELEGVNNPGFLYAAGSSTPFATFHYQSGTGANQYLVVSNITSATEIARGFNKIGHIFGEEGEDSNHGGTTVVAYPSGTGTKRIFTVDAGLLSNSSTNSPYIDITLESARPKTELGVSRPLELFKHRGDSNETIIREVATELDRKTRKSITEATITVENYPMVRLEALGINITRSGQTVNFIYDTANSAKAFTSADGSVTTNDLRVFGIKKGMVVAELDDFGEITRYAYIASVSYSASGNTTGTLTYGTASDGTDTSDGTALNATKNMAIFIPTEPGHSVRIKNKTWNVDTNFIITEITYELNIQGAILAVLKGYGTGVNSSGIPSNIVTVMPNRNDIHFNRPPGQLQWEIPNGFIEAVDHDTIRVQHIDGSSAQVTVAVSDGKRYVMDTGNYNIPYPSHTVSGTAKSIPHTMFLRTKGSVASPLSTDLKDLQMLPNEHSTSSVKTYAELGQFDYDIVFGTVRADLDSSGKATFDFRGSGANLCVPVIDVTAIANNRMTQSLLKKGAQPWSTNLHIEGTAYNAVKWHAKGSSDSTDANVSFGEDSGVGEAITASTLTGLSNNTTYYIYKRIGASANAALVSTTNFQDAYQDERILMATITVGTSASGSAPTILPFNGTIPTISAVSIAGNAITADSIQAGTITASEIDANTITANELASGSITTQITSDMTGVTMNAAGQIMSGKTEYGSGTGYILEYNGGTPKFDIGNTSQHMRWTGSAVDIKGSLTVAGSGVILDSGTAVDSQITFTDSNGGAFRVVYDNSQSNAMLYHTDAARGSNEPSISIGFDEIQMQGITYPNSDGGHLLGKSSKRWHTVYAVNGVSTTSDVNAKTNIAPITKGLDIITSLSPISYNIKDAESNEVSSRVGFGITSQELKEVLLANGYDANVGAYNEDIVYFDDNGNETKDSSGTPKTYWGITYTELIAPLIAAIKELKAEIDALKNG